MIESQLPGYWNRVGGILIKEKIMKDWEYLPINSDDIEEFIDLAVSACEWRYHLDALKYAVIEITPKFCQVAIELQGRNSFPIYTVVPSGECRETGSLSRTEENDCEWVCQIEGGLLAE